MGRKAIFLQIALLYANPCADEPLMKKSDLQKNDFTAHG
jgi:hypothetical protein